MANDECRRCGGTGRIVRVVLGREGMVPCPDCGGDDG